jgi:hypothetical protein
MDVLRRFTSTFCLTGQNLSEAQRPGVKPPTPILCSAGRRAFRPLVILHHRLRRYLGGMYARSSLQYEVFTLGSPAKRQARSVLHPRGWYGFTGSPSGSSVTAA